MPMKSPVHPGEVVLEECILPAGISITAAAKALGVSRQALTNLTTKRSGISAEMAVRLEKVFGSTADFWMRLQAAHDLAGVRARENEIIVTPIKDVRPG